MHLSHNNITTPYIYIYTYVYIYIYIYIFTYFPSRLSFHLPSGASLDATQKISDPEARGVAEKAYKTLQKAAGEGAQSLQQVTPEAAKKQAGDGDGGA